MATYSTYTKTTSTSTSSATLISNSSSKNYMNNKSSLNHHLNNHHNHHHHHHHHHNHNQFITPSTTRYIKNTLPISYQHNSLKTTSTISRCKPTSRYYTSTCTPSLAESNRLERNYSYIEAMKETKSLPSSSNSSSTSTIESPINEVASMQPQIEEVEIPIEIKLIENASNLAKSRSQSSIFNLFRTTFSPFQIRKWRSKSRDKLLYNNASSLNQSDSLPKQADPLLVCKQSQTKKPSPSKNEEFVLPIRSQAVECGSEVERKENNFSYTSSMSSNSNSSADSSTNVSFTKLSPKLASPNNTNSTSRQLSYLKLTCLLNGYDNNEIKDDKNVDSGSVKSIYLKSSKALLNNTERYYDVRPNFKRYTSSSTTSTSSSSSNTKECVRRNEDVEDDLDGGGQVYKSELSVRLNLSDECSKEDKVDDFDLVSKIEPIKMSGQEDVKEDEDKVNTQVSNCNNTKNQNDDCKAIDDKHDCETQDGLAHDGHYFINLLDKSTEHINQLCRDYQTYVDETSENYVQNEEILGQIQTAIGKGQLLINQKFKQFRGLCVKNINDKTDSAPLKEGEFVTRDDDLAGFWDMVFLQVEDIDQMFEKLAQLKKNNWISEVKQVVKTVAKKKTTTSGTTAPKSTETAASKARAEAARQRILEMKKKAALAKSQSQEQPQQQQQQQQEQIVN